MTTEYGAKISRPGKDIGSNDPRDFVLHSGYGTVKICGSFSGSVNVPAGSYAAVEINHGLPFVPVTLFWTKQSTFRWWMGAIKRSSLDIDSNVWVDVGIDGNGDLAFSYVDSTKFRLYLRNSSGGDITVNYFGYFLGGDESGDIASLLTADYGIKVVKEGADVATTDIGEILLHPDLPMLKYHDDQTKDLTIPAGNLTGSISVSHSLGYVPAFIAYVKYTWLDSYQRILPQGRAPQPVIIDAYASISDIVCNVRQTSQGSDKDYNFRVIIFKDQIA